MAWNQLCLPKTAWGLNITYVQVWNKVAILKHYWNLSKKKGRVHIYYVKGGDISDVDAKNASWTIRKIINVKKYLERGNLED